MNTLQRSLRIGATVCALYTLSACTPTVNTHYHWGNYESLIYDMYAQPGKATSAIQIDKLNEDIQQAENNGKPVPPGLYAHLGFMYSIEGNVAAANQAFAEETHLYPDSKTLINGMLERAKAFGASATDNKEAK